MLGQDRVFDRAEERRVDAHADERDQHQLQILEEDAGGAHQHDQDLGGLDDPHDLRLVVGVGELAGERGEEEEGQDEDAGGDRAEPGLVLDRIEDLVGREEDHRVLEQIVVERPEELGDEQRQEPALPHQSERRTMHRTTFTSVRGLSRYMRRGHSRGKCRAANGYWVSLWSPPFRGGEPCAHPPQDSRTIRSVGSRSALGSGEGSRMRETSWRPASNVSCRIVLSAGVESRASSMSS